MTADPTDPNSYMAAPMNGAVPLPSIAAQAAQSAGIPTDLFLNQINQESGFNPAAKNGNAMGIAQFMPATAKERGVDPTDPYQSMYAAAKYMSDLKDQHGTWEDALKHYGTIGKNGPANEGQARILAIAQAHDAEDPTNPNNYVPADQAQNAAPDPSTDPNNYKEAISPLASAATGAGMSVPFGNRALALAQSVTGTPYKDNLDRINKYAEDAKSQNPLSYTGGEIAGSSALAALAPESLIGRGALGAMARFGGLGAAQGASSSSDLSDTADVAKNAALGGAIGAGTSGLAQGVGNTVSGAGKFTQSFMKNAMNKATELSEHIAGKAGPLIEGAAIGSAHGLIAPLAKVYGAALAANKGGAALSVLGKYSGDPGGLLTALQGTRYYAPMLNAFTTSPSAVRGLAMQISHQDPEFRKILGVDDNTDD